MFTFVLNVFFRKPEQWYPTMHVSNPKLRIGWQRCKQTLADLVYCQALSLSYQRQSTDDNLETVQNTTLNKVGEKDTNVYSDDKMFWK